MSWAIETDGLTKRYPRKTGVFESRLLAGRIGGPTKDSLPPPAVDALTLAVREGELFGLLGPNGAGKTTLVKMLCTLVTPTSGRAHVAGFDLQDEQEIKAQIGLASGEERSFYARLSGRSNLEFFARLHHLPPKEIPARVEQVLDAVGLVPAADQPFQTYSTGMRQRLSIARSLLHQPQLLFLDEPTRGLDPLAARQVQRLVRADLVERRGLTVFLTTHDLDEASQICDRLGIMNRGRLLACGSLAELRSSLGGGAGYSLRLSELEENKTDTLLDGIPGAELDWDSETRYASLRFRTPAGNEAETMLQQAIANVGEARGIILEIRKWDLSLEEIFERLVNASEERCPPVLEEEGSARQAGSATLLPVLEPSSQSSALENEHSTAEFPSSQPLADRQPGGAKPAREPALLRPKTSLNLIQGVRIASAFLRRDFLSEASYRLSFFLQFFNIFFQIAVFFFISRLLGAAAQPFLAPYNGDYFSFVLIGIAFAGYFGVGLSSFSSSLRQAQTTGTLEAMLTTPTSLAHIILGSSLWDYSLTTFKVIVYLVCGVLIFGVNLTGANYLAALAVLALTLIAFSSLGIFAASFIMVMKRGDPITWAFSAISGLLGGVYYPISVLPEPLQWVARLIPVTYALEGMRLALLNGAPFSAVFPHLLALALFSAVLLPASLAAFRYAVRRAKIDGSLAHY